MNPIKGLWELVKYFFYDFYLDFKFIKEGIDRHAKTGEFFSEEKKRRIDEGFKNLKIVDIIKEGWIWYWVVALAVVSGFFLAGNYYQSVCNEFIFVNYIEPTIPKGNWSTLIDLTNYSKDFI